MNPSLTAQQLAFFSKNGFLELEELWNETECAHLAGEIGVGRDLWRNSPVLKKLLLSRKLSQLPLELTDSSSLRLAFDHGFPPQFSLPKPTPLKDLFCIQGLACVLLCRFSSTPFSFPAKPPLGLLPFPQKPGNLLLVQPHVLIAWPKEPIGLYAVGYADPNAVFVQNERDPAVQGMKELGYHFGDTLKNELHPLVQKR